MPPKQHSDDEVMDNNGGAYLTRTGVPYYDDGTAYEQELSLRSMLAAMRIEFRQVGKRVENFENTLKKTQTQMAQLEGKIETASSE